MKALELPCLANGRNIVLYSTIFVLCASRASAEDMTRPQSDVVFLAELLALIFIGRLLGEAMTRIRQPSVMGPLLAGILLGPSVLGRLWPDLQQWLFPVAKEQRAMIDAVSQFGVLLLLLLTGMEVDLKLVKNVGKAALVVSFTGIAVPFACGVIFGWWMPESLLPDSSRRLVTSLFLGAALSISSIKVVATIVREMNFARRDLGQVIVASAIMEDTIGWLIVAVIFGFAKAGQVDVANVAKILIGIAVFLIGSFTIGRRLVFYAIRWANDNFISDFAVITTILVIMSVMALTTNFIGVHTVLGAFISGVLIGDSPILTTYIDDQLRGLIVAFFMPIFFGVAGLTVDFRVLMQPNVLLLALGVIAIASIGKFIGAFMGGAIGGLTRAEALVLACGMNARGSTEIIVATIGLSMGALTQNLYTMIVAMAIVTTIAMPPMLRWGLSRAPLAEAEKERLTWEEFEAKQFLPNIERLLLAIDESANGKFATHLAGLIVGRSGIPITVLQLTMNELKRREEANLDGAKVVEETVKAAAEDSKKSSPEEKEPAAVDVTVRKPSETSNEEAITIEAKKGYDLLFVGIDKMKTKDGTLNPDISHFATAFKGPLAIVMGLGDHLKRPSVDRLHILAPITGTDVSRKAAEIAISLGCACDCDVTALYVESGTWREQRWRSVRNRRYEQMILNDVVATADRYNMKIETLVRSSVSPAEAILTEAKMGGYDLIVMGVTWRLGAQLFFGDIAAAVFEKSPSSMLLLSS